MTATACKQHCHETQSQLVLPDALRRGVESACLILHCAGVACSYMGSDGVEPLRCARKILLAASVSLFSEERSFL